MVRISAALASVEPNNSKLGGMSRTHFRPSSGRQLRGIAKHLSSIERWASDPSNSTLRRNRGRWNQLQSSLQALRQTHAAIDAFAARADEFCDGECYLAIYGLLQGLVLQQDALCNLAEALAVKPIRLNRHRRLEEIRNIRNWSVGHPTKADRGDTSSHHAITRTKLGRGGFALYSAFDDGRAQYTYVPLPQLARLQRRVVSKLLRDMLSQLYAMAPAAVHAVNKRATPAIANGSLPRPAVNRSPLHARHHMRSNSQNGGATRHRTSALSNVSVSPPPTSRRSPQTTVQHSSTPFTKRARQRRAPQAVAVPLRGGKRLIRPASPVVPLPPAPSNIGSQ